MRITNKPILLVEDDHVDVMTVRRAFKELRVTNPLVEMENGEEAWPICGTRAIYNRASSCLTSTCLS